MKQLADGRMLMAARADIRSFFEDHHIAGRKIQDILPSVLDYGIRNLYDVENPYDRMNQCGISTDGRICVLFADGDHVEIEFPGDGPILLGFNSADLTEYPLFHGQLYTLRTMFTHAIGKSICAVEIDASDRKMLFPSYRGIDMSDEDEGVWRVRFVLDDDTALAFFGIIDFFCMDHINSDESSVEIPLKWLLDELSEDIREEMLTYDDTDEM